MRWTTSLLASVVLASAGMAQMPTYAPVNQAPAPAPVLIGTTPQPCLDGPTLPLPADSFVGNASGGRLAGNHNFDNFIGFLSNPFMNIDPRAVTEIFPLFLYNSFSTTSALPSGEMYPPGGAGLTVALSERLMVGLNQGGYLFVDLDRNRPGTFTDRFGRVRNRREFEGDREGWLNLGFFAQYTLIEDVPNQFLLSAGLRCIVPSGSKEIFQGQGPTKLAPYLTAGKEIEKFHILVTAGYQFPVESGGGGTEFFYGCVHLDRQMFGCFYPVVEFNWIHHTSSVNVDLPLRDGLFDLGTFQASGNLLAVSVGANVVIVPSKLEIGAVYSTPLATQRNFDFNGFLVKMVVRF